LITEVGYVTTAVAEGSAHRVAEAVIGTTFAVTFARTRSHASITINGRASSVDGIVVVAAVGLGSADTKGITVVTFTTVGMARAGFGVQTEVVVVAAAVTEADTGLITEAVFTLTIAVAVTAAFTSAILNITVAKVITDISTLGAEV